MARINDRGEIIRDDVPAVPPRQPPHDDDDDFDDFDDDDFDDDSDEVDLTEDEDDDDLDDDDDDYTPHTSLRSVSLPSDTDTEALLGCSVMTLCAAAVALGWLAWRYWR